MAVVMCRVCKKPIKVPPRKWSYIDPQEPVCSKECVFEWIRRQDGYLSGDFTELSGDARASDAYSPKLGMWFRSMYECCFAEALAAAGFPFLYEQYMFNLGEGSHYVPDFYFPGHGCFVEVKGKWGVGAKTKIRTFRRLYRTTPLLVVPWTLREEFFPGDFC